LIALSYDLNLIAHCPWIVIVDILRDTDLAKKVGTSDCSSFMITPTKCVIIGVVISAIDDLQFLFSDRNQIDITCQCLGNFSYATM